MERVPEKLQRKERLLADVLNLTPSSMNTSDEQIQHLDHPEPMHNHLDDHDYDQPIIERPQLQAAKLKTENIQRKLKRQKKKQKMVSEKNQPRHKKKASQLKREEVGSFICWDENSC